MSHEVGGTPEPAEDELALERAIDQAVNQTESAGDGERDNAQLQAALRGLISVKGAVLQIFPRQGRDQRKRRWSP
jgi:hypothetical protein